MVKPGLQRLLNKELEHSLTKIQRKKKELVNLILDLPETNTVITITKGKTFVALNRFSVRHFIVVRR